MRKSYQLAGWIRRAETAHRKLVQLAEDIEAAGGDPNLYALAASAHCEAHQLVSELEGHKAGT